MRSLAGKLIVISICSTHEDRRYRRESLRGYPIGNSLSGDWYSDGKDRESSFPNGILNAMII
jgi:hypothetical protein